MQSEMPSHFKTLSIIVVVTIVDESLINNNCLVEVMARTSKRAKLAAFGNPLVDMIVSDEGGEVTEKYNLQLNVAQEMDTVQTGILQDITDR